MANDKQFILNSESLKQLNAAIETFRNKIEQLCRSFDDFINGCSDCMKDAPSIAILTKAKQIPATLRAIINPTTLIEEKLLSLAYKNEYDA